VQSNQNSQPQNYYRNNNNNNNKYDYNEQIANNYQTPSNNFHSQNVDVNNVANQHANNQMADDNTLNANNL
jgi:hypothetical protein